MNYYLQGLSVGLAYVAPIGMQNLFVINSALTNTRRRTMLTALILIFFDVLLSFSCFFGIGAVMQRFQWLQMVVLAVGSLIVIYIGIGLMCAKGRELDRSQPNMSIGKTIYTAFVVTWINPQAIIDGTMMLGAFRVTLPSDRTLPFICGVASASCLWFTSISLLISVFSSKFDSRVMRWINVVCGAVILFYGGKLLVSFFQMLLR